MTSLEDDLRTELARVAGRAPALPGLAASALVRGRRARRRRAVAGTAAGVAAVAVAVVGVVAGAGLVRPEPDLSGRFAAPPVGPPAVAVYTGQGAGELTRWVADDVVTGKLGATSTRPVASLPDGRVLLVDEQGRLRLLGLGDEQGQVLVEGLQGPAAVASDGRRAAVVVEDAGTLVVKEVSVPSGRELRRAVLAVELLGVQGSPVPLAYAGDSVLLVREGGGTVLWSPGQGTVGGASGSEAFLGGSAATADAPGGRVVVRREGSCAEVRALPPGTGTPWELCREPFIGFSPDGTLLLASNAVGDGLVVRDAADGDLLRAFEVPASLRAYAWESDGSTLHTTVDGDRTLLVRCAVLTGDCATVVTFPGTDRIPEPVPPAG